MTGPVCAVQLAEQAYKRQLLMTDRLDERNRGLLWLSVITLFLLWIAGALLPCMAQTGGARALCEHWP